MGKISPVSIKYIIRTALKLSGRVEKPDVIGAVFGQTEGLLGADLELRELQKNGRIGRIDVNIDIKKGKAEGEILVPSSMGKSETALIAAALETIERIGPCDAKIEVTTIEDVRVSKRNYVIKRAKELLRKFVETMPDAAALTKDVSQTVRSMDIITYGEDKLPAGKGIEDAEEIIVVEGRADVLNLLKYGIHNVIALNGSKAPHSIVGLIKSRETTVFVDGDRGGDLILKNLEALADIDFVAHAPDGKEVEELTLKEINKALRSKSSLGDYKAEKKERGARGADKPRRTSRTTRSDRSGSRDSGSRRTFTSRSSAGKLADSEKKDIKKLSDELVGTKGAYLLDGDLEVLGKVPVKELGGTLSDMDDVYAVVMDGYVDRTLTETAEKKKVKHVVAKSVSTRSDRVNLVETSAL